MKFGTRIILPLCILGLLQYVSCNTASQYENPLDTGGSADSWIDPPPGWIKVWEDTFDLPDGSDPSASNWTYDTGSWGWGNSEWENYTDTRANSFIQDGKLVIKASQVSGYYRLKPVA